MRTRTWCYEEKSEMCTIPEMAHPPLELAPAGFVLFAPTARS